MSLAAIDALAGAVAGMRGAIDRSDVAEMENFTRAVHSALLTVKAQGAWRDSEPLREKLRDLLPQIEAVRLRTNILADHTRKQLDLLAARGASAAPLTYTR